MIWAGSWDYGAYHIGDQRRLRRACALRWWSMAVDDGSDQNQTSSPTGWPRMRFWKMSLMRTKSTIISWVGSIYITRSFRLFWIVGDFRFYRSFMFLSSISVRSVIYQNLESQTLWLLSQLISSHTWIVTSIYVYLASRPYHDKREYFKLFHKFLRNDNPFA